MSTKTAAFTFVAVVDALNALLGCASTSLAMQVVFISRRAEHEVCSAADGGTTVLELHLAHEQQEFGEFEVRVRPRGMDAFSRSPGSSLNKSS